MIHNTLGTLPDLSQIQPNPTISAFTTREILPGVRVSTLLTAALIGFGFYYMSKGR